MSKITLVGGTWSAKTDPTLAQWEHPGSQFSRWLQEFGIYPLEPAPFFWSGHLDGICGNDLDWHEAANNLAYRLIQHPPEDRNVFAHSHGGTVAVLAATKVPINNLVTAGTPIRKKTDDKGREAMQRHMIRGWYHLYAPGGFWADKMQALGSLFDGRWGLRRTFDIPGVENIGVTGIDHSTVLYDRRQFDRALVQGGVIPFLRGEGMGV